MRQVFLDTVGLIALWDEADPWNPRASAAMKALDMPGIRLVTTPYILLECGNALARTAFRADVFQFREQLARERNLIDSTPDEMSKPGLPIGAIAAGAQELSITFRSWSCAVLASPTRLPTTSISRRRGSTHSSDHRPSEDWTRYVIKMATGTAPSA